MATSLRVDEKKSLIEFVSLYRRERFPRSDGVYLQQQHRDAEIDARYIFPAAAAAICIWGSSLM